MAPLGLPEDEPVSIPITGELDLHTFQPRDFARLFDAYFAACREKGIFTVRVVHGKGTGALREQVRTQLSRHPLVSHLRNADESSGSWGATWADLKRF